MPNFQPHTREDIPLRIKWLNNHKASMYVLDRPNHVTNEKEQDQWFDEYEERATKGKRKFFTILSGKTPIGFMGLFNITKGENSKARAFILIGEDKYRGRGFGEKSMNHLINYVCNDLGIKTLYLEVDNRNVPAINLYDKLGFKRTGEYGKYIGMSRVC